MDRDDAPETSPYEIVGGPAGLPADVYRRLFEASFGLAIVVDAAGVVRAMSDAATLSAGSEALGRPLDRALGWSEPERIAEGLDTARGGAYDRFYTRVLGADGHLVFLVDLQSVDGPDGETWALLEARDVTTLVAIEHQLHDVLRQLEHERNRLRAVLDATPDRIVGIDAAGTATVVNQAVAEAAGTDRESVEGQPYLDRAQRPDLWRRALAGETVRTRIPPGGSTFGVWIDLTLAPVLSGDFVEGAVAIGRDATVQVEAAQLRLAITHGRAAMVAIGSDGQVEMDPGPARELFGVDAADTLDGLMAHVRNRSTAEGALRVALGVPGTPVDLRLEVADRTVWVRGRSMEGASTRFVGVAYAVDDAVDAAVNQRWEDLADRGGWAGRRPADRIDPQVGGDPDPEAVDARVAALRRTGLLDTGPSRPFDVLTRAVSDSLGVPVSLLSLVDAERQFFASQTGLTGWASDDRETPLSHSFCQHVANERRPLVVRDARETKRLAANGAIEDLGVVAYLGVPVAAPDGHVIGALCAIDSVPHAWTEEDVRLMSSLAEAASAEVARRQATPPDPTD
ncbi:GAF domain-containing protein [Rubrivirga sp. IMCC45206]|uniref:GAF domain-containing protein n=1 Tax=Rubrivirga sp. IMCC45206 TaxID=3391614 RepID=UPI0039900C14